MTPPAITSPATYDISGTLNAMLAENQNNARLALEKQIRLNFKYRDKNRTLLTENEELKKQIPDTKSHKVITVEEAKEFEAFKALGLKPKDVETLRTEHGTLTKQVADANLAKIAKDAADALKWPGHEVLLDQVKQRGLHIELRDGDVTDADGKTVKGKVPYVRLAADEKAAMVPLKEYADKNLKLYLPALMAGGQTEDSQELEYPEEKPAPKSRAPGSAKDLVKHQIDSKYTLPGDKEPGK